MKQCSQCNRTKVEDEFYPKKSWCKSCERQYRREYYRANKDKVKQYQAEYYHHNRQERRDYQNEYNSSVPVNRAEAVVEWRTRNPEKRRAHAAVYNAIKRGKMVRPERCSVCRSTDFIHAHHDDYSKPLDVIWLCASCHRKRHTQLGL